MEVFILMIFIGIIVMIVRAGRSESVSSSWQEVAEKLGVRASTGGFNQRERLAGKFHGFDVRVHTHTRGSGTGQKPFTVYRVRYPSLRLGLKLRRQDALSGIAKFLGSDDHVIGQQAFDDNVVIGGRSLPAVRGYLTAERRASILRAMHRHPSLEITDTEIKLTSRGIEQHVFRLEDRVRQLCELARVLSRDKEHMAAPGRGKGQRNRPGPATTAQAAAGLAAFDLPPPVPATNRRPVAPPPLPEPAPPREPEPEPSWEPEPAQEAEPEIAEIEEPLEVDEPVAIEEPVEVEEPAPAAPDEIDVVGLSNDLFGSGTMGSETDRIFAEKYENRSVRWSGSLDRVDSYYRDSVFGEGPATKIVLLVHEIVEDRYGGREVHAVVQLPADAADALRPRRGKRIPFAGRLVGCDAFMRHVFVADGRILDG
jgi:hypothetical protein